MKIAFINILFLFILGNCMNVDGQKMQMNKNNKNFISDGQEYMLVIKNDNKSRINIVFYPELEYKITIFPEFKTSVIEMNINDTNGTLIYTNSNKKYIKEWNFKFLSLINTTIDFKLRNSTNKEEMVRVLVAFRKPDKEPEKSE